MHVGDKYVDPDTGRVIGREALYVGQAQVEREGDETEAACHSASCGQRLTD